MGGEKSPAFSHVYKSLYRNGQDEGKSLLMYKKHNEELGLKKITRDELR